MTTDVDIRGGGAVAVDTATLRSAATRVDRLAAALEEHAERVGSLQFMLGLEREQAAPAWEATAALRSRIFDVIAGATELATRLREAAAVYELVELDTAHLAAVLGGDAAAARALDARRDALIDAHPEARWEAFGAVWDRGVMWPAHLVRQATEGGFDLGQLIGPEGAIVGGVAFGGATLAATAFVGMGGFGRIPRGARLQGGAASVAVRPLLVQGSRPAAPIGLAGAAARIPNSGQARVRVERYAMPDGTRHFAVYVAGTSTLTAGGADPWDTQSNVELYSGHRSASYDATRQALEDAGAERGDVVHAFGHSQGGMIVSHLAVDGAYDTRTLVTFGSPVEADVASGTVSVGVRHTDDPVAALAGGGHLDPVGAPGSFIAEREAHPPSGVSDASIPAHGLEAYTETAALVDASGDPRVDDVSAAFAELGEAVEVDVFEFAAERVTDPDQPSPLPDPGDRRRRRG